ncbi:Hypothetical protein PSEBR_m1049 [Pseudomonas brassicacearum subsp. brassicacearum NFM421]|uniref:Uncharacterized protein n=1 Tax=Pseudomonas brassicacearum (strain NFM421) TaxID=994484 RepID=F2K7T0_PSEBN|nr:Hypothetical protein PSEBR_m1049 [Pseudomonas brassicacearum subsp. brassicacearum NFM421]
MGASLLAMTAAHSTSELPDTPLSRASSLPHLTELRLKRCKHDHNTTDHGPGPGEIPR